MPQQGFAYSLTRPHPREGQTAFLRHYTQKSNTCPFNTGDAEPARLRSSGDQAPAGLSLRTLLCRLRLLRRVLRFVWKNPSSRLAIAPSIFPDPPGSALRFTLQSLAVTLRNRIYRSGIAVFPEYPGNLTVLPSEVWMAVIFLHIFFQALEAFLLVAALSVDALVSGFAYGADRIKIPLMSVGIISAVCSGILAAALFLGRAIGGLLPAGLASGICFAILLLLGLVKLFDSGVKGFIRKHNGLNKKISFSAFSLGFILHIYADPEEADKDRSKTLSPAEAASLAIALSFDGLAVGFGAGIASVNPFMAIGFSLVTTAACVLLGSLAGNRLARRTSLDLTWLGGAILIVLAALKLF